MRYLKCAAMMLIAGAANAADGLIEVKSPHSVNETITRLEAAAKERKLTIFLRVDHAAGAQKIGTTLRSTELLIFGNPQGGTPLMECTQSTGIDLPLKALAWEDASGQVWLGYNDMDYLIRRHQATECRQLAAKLGKALASLVQDVVK